VRPSGIRNFVQLTERIATSGQPTPDQLPQIAAAGYRVVINLAMPDHPESFAGEAQQVSQLGMQYIHIPVPFDAPEPGHVRQFCEAIQQHEHEQVWVHCIMNYRVSAFLYLYLKHRRGYGEKEARSPMFDHWQPDPVWQEVLNWNAEVTDSDVR